MKKLFYILACILVTASGYAQTDAISYQAVILNPDSQQLPGNDAVATVLPETDVSLRFTIINENGFREYQEIHDITTDLFGMVNLFIGQGARTTNLQFTDVLWAGKAKTLLVEIDFYRLGDYVQLSAEQLTFTPQAFHRDIIATGDMEVEGKATIQGDFTIEGVTSINNDLEISGNALIEGDAQIEGSANIEDDLTVEGTTNLNSELFVNNQSPTRLSGTLNVLGTTVITDSLRVTRNVALNQNLFVDGDAEIEGDQLVLGDVVFDRGLSVRLPTALNDDLSVGGRSDLEGILSVNAATDIAGTLDVGGSTTIGDEISAAGSAFFGASMDVIGKTTLSDNLEVNGLTSLNNDFKVDGGSTSLLTGPVSIGGKTDVNNSLNVLGAFPTDLSGSLHVVKNAVFDDDVLIDGMLTVNNNLNLPGLFISGDGTVDGGHVALFENTGGGSGDGIAIRINSPELSSENRFVSFFGQGSYLAGRIESFNASDSSNIPQDISNPNDITQSQGIVYGSRGADYAEWLEKENPGDTFLIGEVVGIKGGKISRNTADADHVLTISMAPIVLGNMPDENRKDAFEKVGFMGQVPALVKGKVSKGDYIVASGNNDGYAVAIPPNEITLDKLKWVIGKAWSESTSEGKSLINVSVGLKSNEWVSILEQQENRIKEMESKLKSLERLEQRLQKIESKVDAADMN